MIQDILAIIPAFSSLALVTICFIALRLLYKESQKVGGKYKSWDEHTENMKCPPPTMTYPKKVRPDTIIKRKPVYKTDSDWYEDERKNK